MDESGITKEEQMLIDLCKHLENDGFGDVESYFKDNGITATEVDSYVNDADDKGFSWHNIYKVELKEKSFYFIYEWYGGRWSGSNPAIYIAEPYQEIRYKSITSNIGDTYYEEIYE